MKKYQFRRLETGGLKHKNSKALGKNVVQLKISNEGENTGKDDVIRGGYGLRTP